MNTRPLGVGITRDRLAQVSSAARALHRTILRSFATIGRPPESADPLLRELHDRDVIRLDDQGRIQAAYPFSAMPTRHVVSIEDGPKVYAMCAIDALGIADMLGREVAIRSTDPWSDEPVLVIVRDGQAEWHPAETVVLVGSEGDRCGPAAERCCGLMNFFTSKDNAIGWWSTRPGASGDILATKQAFELGVEIFGRLLDE